MYLLLPLFIIGCLCYPKGIPAMIVILVVSSVIQAIGMGWFMILLIGLPLGWAWLTEESKPQKKGKVK